ncbi:hypothetical protein [Deinococcus ruber]|uniref:Uncharacterized protein n=1 Tax=Deinococcus ruber TaxID=1848197 RepID=A0A918CKX0_9DEIO|nr:hypothetical protein [Deinococcus ruber]GGR29945.1 hypothetical protein GCM10008957_46000 [Deinococcus ruber]
MSVFTPSDDDEQPHLLIETPSFDGVLSQPGIQQTPEGQLHTFCFENGYGALVMRSRNPEFQLSSEYVFEVCLLDCSRLPHRPTFELTLCPSILVGLERAEVCDLLIAAERLPRHPNMTHHDELLLEEDF